MNLKKNIYEYFNKSGFRRKILGLLSSVYSTYKNRRLCRIFYDDCWIHINPDGVVCDRNINTALSISKAISETELYCSIYRPKLGDTILDIGAGIGDNTYLFSKLVGPNGKVIAVEAHPKLYSCLIKLCEYNKLHNVIALNHAILDCEGDFSIEDSEQSICCRVVDKKTNIRVKGTTVDKLMDYLKINKIDFLKMNIEGSEKRAINGMSKSIQKTRHICIACHDFLAIRDGIEIMKTKDIIINFLEKNGFKIIVNDFDERPWVRDHVFGINQNLFHTK